MALKILCSQLARKPLALDVILLFEKPASILHPLCELLDSWKYEEDQGEYQPVYEEFGSVLLLTLAIAYRYNLSASDLGAKSTDSFVAKLLYQGSISRPSDNHLSDETKGHLDAWIRGLFDQDAGGLSDDLISCCTPQEFYLLVPTLFQHIVMAFRTGHLSEDGLKGGVECRLMASSPEFERELTSRRPRRYLSLTVPRDGDNVSHQLAMGRCPEPKDGYPDTTVRASTRYHI